MNQQRDRPTAKRRLYLLREDVEVALKTRPGEPGAMVLTYACEGEVTDDRWVMVEVTL